MRTHVGPEPLVDQLGAEFGAFLIERVAPDEEGLYPEIIGSYKARTAKGGSRSDDQPLALGAGEIVGIVSPLVWSLENLG